MAGVYAINTPRRRSLFSRLSVNNTIILVNVILFFALIIFQLFYKGDPQVFLDYIALKPSNIVEGKYIWTFLTSMFMHGGFFHLLVNMLSLFFIGSLLQKILGAKRYLSFYLISGLFARVFFVLASFIFPADFNVFAVGASGALFGLIGLLMLMTPNLPVYVMFIPIPIKIKYAAPGILVLLWLISAAGNVPIGNTAHLGGLIAGLAYGIYLRSKYKKKVRAIGKHFS